MGWDQIKAWSNEELIGAEGTMDARQVEVHDDQVVVADRRSTHANELSEFTFDVQGDSISRMTIRGAD